MLFDLNYVDSSYFLILHVRVVDSSVSSKKKRKDGRSNNIQFFTYLKQPTKPYSEILLFSEATGINYTYCNEYRDTPLFRDYWL